MLGAIGVVYGDIGTSPLYALKSCFSIGGLPVTPENVFGLISIFIWSLLLIVTIKYIVFVMRVDEEGEGGILILSSICEKLDLGKYLVVPMVLGIVGAALIFGDGVITPAISVLGALEGLQIISPWLSEHTVIFAFIIITILFYIQKNGSGGIGMYFGPIMIIWFTVISVLGLVSIFRDPTILLAFNPYYAAMFFVHNGWMALLTLGGAILVVTGAEAIYADMGHFGRKSIAMSWLSFVLPALLLNYLGQGALLLSSPGSIENPFYFLVPVDAIYPMIVLSTLATIIASQAIISGVFSLVWQGIMLNYLPRLTVLHTSSEQMGQVYLPSINLVLYIFTISAVVVFRSSENLAVAYGLSVAGCMLITSFLLLLVAIKKWEWPLSYILLLFVPLLSMDFMFFGTNLIKILEGAWYAVLVTSIAAYTIFVWIKGSAALEDQKSSPHKGLKSFIQDYRKKHRTFIPGTGVFMTRNLNKVPSSLIIHLNHNKFMHKKLIFISVILQNVPKVTGENKYVFHQLMPSVYTITARFGFMEEPSLRKVLNWAKTNELIESEEELSFILSKGVPVISAYSKLSRFGELLYIFLSKNSLSAYEFYSIPNHLVVELGVRYRV